MRYSTYKLLKGTEVKPETLEPHEEAVWEGLKSFGYWFFMLAIVCIILYVLTV